MNTVRRLVTLAVVVALLVPVAIDRDSFPLSTYPMYAFERQRTVDFSTAVGVDADGDRHRLGLRAIGGSDDPLIVASLVGRAVDQGEDTANDLCADIAERVADRRDDLVAVEVVVERHDIVSRAEDEPSLSDTTPITSCPVPEPTT